MHSPLLKLIDLSKYYSTKDAVTLGLRKVSAEFHKGEFVAITGESGSGKSTLLNVLSGIDSYEDGEMYLNGDETSCYTTQDWDDYRRENIAFIFQDYSLIDSYTVLQNVELPLYDKFPKKKDRRKRALELLQKVDLLSHKRHKCTKLSGGQKQRVAIARALAKDAPIILADEPTGNLDSATSNVIIKLMAETAKDKLLIMVTHSFDDVEGVATRRIRMHDGSIVEDKKIIAVQETNQQDDQKNELKIENNNIKSKIILQKAKKSLFIAANNLFATPKRSLFILSTSFLATLMLAFFMFSYLNIIIPPPGQNMMGDRKDTIYVIDKDRNDLDGAKLASIKEVEGVKAALSNYSVYKKSIYPTSMIWGGVSQLFELRMTLLTTANMQDKVPAYGSLPKNENEILLGWANKGEPDLSLIGKEVEIVLPKQDTGWFFEGMLEYEAENMIRKTFILAGYDTGENCYLTEKGLENFSLEYENNDALMLQLSIYYYVDNDDLTRQANEYIYSSRTVIVEDALAEPATFYYVYDPDRKIGNDYIWQLYDRGDLYSLGMLFNNQSAKEIMATVTINNNYMKSKEIKIVEATPTKNTEIYNANIGEDFVPLLVVKDLTNYYVPESNDTTALVVIDDSRKVEKIIDDLTAKGFKVIYPYSRPLSIGETILKLVRQIMSILVGIILMVIAVSLISEVYSRVSRSKKKDFNIFRTVGLSNSLIKSINYSEFLLINISAFMLTFISFIVFVVAGSKSGNPKIINVINSLLPYGAVSSQAIAVYAGVFALLMILTFFIATKVYKKIFKTRVKKSLSESA